MNLITIFNQFPEQQSCIANLKTIRWPEQATGYFSHSSFGSRIRIQRWQAYTAYTSQRLCPRDFGISST